MIDTRTKIVSQSEARRLADQGDLRVVLTYCDPMLPAHVRALRDLAGKRRLLLVIHAPYNAFLDPRARAEIASSLSFVAAVVIGDASFAQSLNAFDATRTEREHRTQFIESVRRKSRS